MSLKFNPTVKQKEYINKAKARWNFKVGATRSGKTFMDIAFVIPSRIRKVAGQDGISVILGVTKETIERNVLEPMRTRYGKSLVGEIDNRNRCNLFGEKIYCLGAEKVSQVSKIRGASFKYVYGDEVAEWNQEVFELLKSRLDKPYSCFDGTLNPEYPSHWVKKFIDSDVDKYIQNYTIDDNPYLDTSFVEALKNEYRGTVYYDRYILGLWVVAEGSIYPMFSKAKHIVPSIERNYSRYYVSMDYGIQNATSMGLWGLCEGVWYRIKEYYHSGRDTNQQKTDEEYYSELLKLIGNRKISGIIIDPSAASFIILTRKKGMFNVIEADNDVLEGIQNCCGVLNNYAIKINDCCKAFIDEIQGYVWDSKSLTQDKPLKVNDHAMDDFRYFVNTAVINKRLATVIPRIMFGGRV